MRLRGVLILTLGLALVGLALLGRVYWWGNSQPKATVVLTLPPTPTEALTVEGLHPPAIKPEWKDKMRAYYTYWERMPTWVSGTVETEKGQVPLKYWQLPLVSTGVWDDALVTLSDGKKFDLKVLYALGEQVNQGVTVLPVAVKVSYHQSEIDFSEGDELPLGRAFFLSADAPFANPLGLNWDACPWASHWCDLGKAIEMRWPGYTGLILRRVLLQRTPEGFVLYGLQAKAVPSPNPWVSTVVPDLSTWEVSP